MKMDESVRSGIVLKKKSSSGCLIIKKKDGNKPLVAGSVSLDDHLEKKPKPVEFMRRKMDYYEMHTDSISGRKRFKSGSVESREYGRDDEGDDDDTVFKVVQSRGSKKLNEFGLASSSRNLSEDKWKQDTHVVGPSGVSKEVEYGAIRYKRFKSEEDGKNIPVSSSRSEYHDGDDKPIRLQGKNGVLKVMVNKKKRMDLPSLYKNHNPWESEERKGSVQEVVVKKDVFSQLPLISSPSPPENRGLLNAKKQKRNERLLENVEPAINRAIDSRDLALDGDDTVLKLAPPGSQTHISSSEVKNEEERSAHENVIPAKDKEGRGKRGGSTEKQMLREKIRQILLDSGWSIDYRRRRNRDYLDAVYINPCGTAYWSIIKAYEAFKKQFEEGRGLVKSNPSLAPVSEDLINKLTRKTKKKIELEMKRKLNEDDMAKQSIAKVASKTSDNDVHGKSVGSYIEQTQKSPLLEVGQENAGTLKRKPGKITVDKASTASNSDAFEGKRSKMVGRCTIQGSRFGKGEDSEPSRYTPHGKKTTILAWLIDAGVVRLSEKVQFVNHKKFRVMLEGWITREGIHCGCCSKILTVSRFELHAGRKLRQPFQNLFLESGVSLLQCQIDAWNHKLKSLSLNFPNAVDGDDPCDDTCGICRDGGDLICCDSCPSTFHQSCLEIQTLPSGDWHCSNCTCKFCGAASKKAAEENDNVVGELIRCSFCWKKYHESCSLRMCALPMASNGATFCGLTCQELSEHLQSNLGVRHELGNGFSWSLIQRADVSDVSQSGFPQRVECNSKLAIASSIMDECFCPVLDKSGTNTIQGVLFNSGSNHERRDYNGFYTAILEQGDEIISAASIRIHGWHLAEMPFIGTREISRRQGMCRRLLSAVETELCSLSVEKLVVPAWAGCPSTWAAAFGFHPLDDARKKELKFRNMLVFPGTEMLQKQLPKHEVHDDGTNALESLQNHQPPLVGKSIVESSMQRQRHVN